MTIIIIASVTLVLAICWLKCLVELKIAINEFAANNFPISSSCAFHASFPEPIAHRRVHLGLDKIPDAHDAAPQRLELHGVLVVLLADELLQVDHFKHLRRHEPPCNRRLGLRALFDGMIFPRLNMRGMKRKNRTYSRKNIENPLTYARSANA